MGGWFITERGLVDDNGRGLSRCSRQDTGYLLVRRPLPVLPVLSADEYQAKQLAPSSALTKFPLGGEVFGKELRARDKKKVAPLMHSRPPVPFPSSRIDRGLIFNMPNHKSGIDECF